MRYITFISSVQIFSVCVFLTVGLKLTPESVHHLPPSKHNIVSPELRGLCLRSCVFISCLQDCTKVTGTFSKPRQQTEEQLKREQTTFVCR